jgi:Protein of unknown function (DUF4242)
MRCVLLTLTVERDQGARTTREDTFRATSRGTETCRGVIERNADEDVTWIHSYVRDDATKSFCVIDA